MNRDRAIHRLKGLLLRTRSKNKHEADTASMRARELADKYALDVEEAWRQIREDEGPSWRKTAAPVPQDTPSWRGQIARTVASRAGCQALVWEDRLRFDGARSAEADAAYRRLAREIEEACERAADSEGCAGPHGPTLRALFSAIFLMEAARAFADGSPRHSSPSSHLVPKDVLDDVKNRKLSTSDLAHAACRLGRRCGLDLVGEEGVPQAPPPAEPPRPEPDRFDVQPGVLVVRSRRPGNFATLFCDDGRRLPFRRDASSFDDVSRRYAWAFARGENERGRVVFATADRALVGVLEDERVETTCLEARVARTREGEPMHVERILTP